MARRNSYVDGISFDEFGAPWRCNCPWLVVIAVTIPFLTIEILQAIENFAIFENIDMSGKIWILVKCQSSEGKEVIASYWCFELAGLKVYSVSNVDDTSVIIKQHQ